VERAMQGTVLDCGNIPQPPALQSPVGSDNSSVSINQEKQQRNCVDDELPLRFCPFDVIQVHLFAPELIYIILES
jgi:hypothetical protein